jgi:hypothetical protein
LPAAPAEERPRRILLIAGRALQHPGKLPIAHRWIVNPSARYHPRPAVWALNDYKAHFANPYSAAERGYLDDVIEPHQTRPKLIRALRTLQTKRVEQPKRKHGNIPL